MGYVKAQECEHHRHEHFYTLRSEILKHLSPELDLTTHILTNIYGLQAIQSLIIV